MENERESDDLAVEYLVLTINLGIHDPCTEDLARLKSEGYRLVDTARGRMWKRKRVRSGNHPQAVSGTIEVNFKPDGPGSPSDRHHGAAGSPDAPQQ